MISARNYTFDIPDKLQIVREFSPLVKPLEFKNEDTPYFIIWNLYDRVCEAIKSFLTLVDNKHIYDAFIITGHALETCAALSYIKDNKTEAEQKENYNKYLARAAAGILIEDLKTSQNLEQDSTWNAYASMLKMFYPVGATIIKDDKNPIEKHEEVIKKINYRLGTNAEKIKLLERNYTPPRPEEYIDLFSKTMDSVDEERFIAFYIKFCNYKHSNVLACLEGTIYEFQFERCLDVMLGIRIYLDESSDGKKLIPYLFKQPTIDKT